MKEKLKRYLTESNTLQTSEPITIEEISNGNNSNHHNFKVSAGDKHVLARITNPDNTVSYTSLSDEFTILKQVEKFDVAPSVILIDLENFETPLLLEEYIEGTDFNNLENHNQEMLQGAVDLISRVSSINITENDFPFKFTYTTYTTNFKIWNIRLNESIENTVGLEDLLNDMRMFCGEVKSILEEKEERLTGAPVEFIYNDVHPGNMFWSAHENKAKFIDWQKVSLGDPTFMLALFIRRFAELWPGEYNFNKKVLDLYPKSSQIKNFEKLLHARILERATSDMVWSIWSKAKQGQPLEISDIKQNKYYQEAKTYLESV